MQNGETAGEVDSADVSVSAVALDMSVPGLFGVDTLGLIRGVRPDVPELLVSGYAAEELAGPQFYPGPEGFLHKPFRVDELLRRLRGLMQK